METYYNKSNKLISAYIYYVKVKQLKYKAVISNMLDIVNDMNKDEFEIYNNINISIFDDDYTRIIISYSDNNNELKKLFVRLPKLDIITSKTHVYGLLLHTLIGEGTSMYWGINPNKLTNLDKSFKMLECFASPFNHYCDNYFSVFPGDKVFGACGNFFTDFASIYEDINTDNILFTVNPPFTEKIIINTIQQVVMKLTTSKNANKYVFLLYLPKWDDLYYDEEGKFKHIDLDKYIFVEKHLTDYVYDFSIKKNIKMIGFSIRLFIIYANIEFNAFVNDLVNRF